MPFFINTTVPVTRNMNKIDSPDNATIKRFASLKEKKYRALHGMYLLEGARIVKDALISGVEIEAVFVREDCGHFIKELNLTETDPRCYLVSERAFKLLSDTETPQGIIAAAKIPQNINKPFGGRGLLLDGISDAGNLGTLIRSAAGFGYKDVYLLNCADPYSPKTVRSTMAGIFRVNVRECGIEILDELKNQGVQLLAADMNGADAAGFKPRDKFALCIGSEARGLSQEVKGTADKTVALKQQDIESLNAAVAGSILMYLYS